MFSGPDIEQCELWLDVGGVSAEEFESECGFERGQSTDGGTEYSGGIAGFGGAWGWREWHEASEAGGFAGEDGQHLSAAAGDTGEDPGDMEFESGIIDEVSGFEVVGAIEDEVDVLAECPDVAEVEVGDDGFDVDFGVDSTEPAVCSDGFGELFGGVGFVEEDLALEVGEFDEVAIDDADVSDAGAGQAVGKYAAECTAAGKQDSAVFKALLSEFADAAEEHLFVVAGRPQHESSGK
ncbi:MAG: hypothetical protein RLZZ458_3389 [Planctomycetota bacterium]